MIHFLFFLFGLLLEVFVSGFPALFTFVDKYIWVECYHDTTSRVLEEEGFELEEW